METNDFIVKKLPKKYRTIAIIIASVVIQFTIGIVYTFGNNFFILILKLFFREYDALFGVLFKVES